jgi:hypothetical protein
MLNGVSGTHNKSVAHIDVTSPVEASFPARPNRLFKFKKRGQLFIGVHNKTLSVVAAMRVSNSDRSRLVTHGSDPADTPTGFLEIRRDYSDTFGFP